jgi:hypothetical protein
MHPSDDMEFENMPLCIEEQDVLLQCKNRLYFVSSFFTQEGGFSVQLSYLPTKG